MSDTQKRGASGKEQFLEQFLEFLEQFKVCLGWALECAHV